MIPGCKTGVWLGIFFACLFFLVPFIWDYFAIKYGGEKSSLFSIILITPLSLLFLFLSWLAFHISKLLPYRSIAIDDDGIWPAHSDKEDGFIPWDDITSIQDRILMQRLDLRNDEGIILIKLDYLLEEFDHLRSIVTNKIRIQSELPELPVTCNKTFKTCFGIVLVLLIIFISWESIFLLGLWFQILSIGLCIVLVHEFFVTILKVIIDKDHLIIKYPLITRKYKYSQIESVQITNTGERFFRGTKAPEVELKIKESNKPHKLKGFKIKANKLHQIILSVWRDHSGKASPVS